MNYAYNQKLREKLLRRRTRETKSGIYSPVVEQSRLQITFVTTNSVCIDYSQRYRRYPPMICLLSLERSRELFLLDHVVTSRNGKDIREKGKRKKEERNTTGG